MVVRGLLAVLLLSLSLLPFAAGMTTTATTTTSGPFPDHPRGVSGQVCAGDPSVAVPDARGCRGAGIPHATVRLVGSGVDVTAQTDDWGSFYLDAPGGVAYTVSASRAGFEPREVRAEPGGPYDVSLVPQKVTVAGHVLDGAGQPVAGASVGFCCAAEGVAPAQTGTDGAYGLSLPAGAYSLEVLAKGFAPHQAQAFVDGSPLDVTLRPEPERTAVLGVVVLDQGGNPLSGVAVAVDQYSCCERGESHDPPLQVGLHERQVTALDGRTAFRVYPDGQVEVRADDPATSPASTSVWVQGDGPAAQELRVVRFPGRDAHVTGRVVDADTGRGIAGYSLSAEHLQFGRSECSEDPRTGRSGTATYAPYTTTYTMPSPYPPPYRGDAPGCAIRLQPDGTFAADLMPGFTRIRAYAPQHCTETQDAGGGFRRTCGPEYLPSVLSLDLPAGNTTDLVLRLHPRPAPDAVVSGYLVDAATQHALPLGRIEFSNEEVPGYGFATTDGDGSYRIRLRSGVHTVTARVDGYFEWQGTVVVPPGDLPLDVLLTVGGPEGWGKPWDGCCWDRPMYAPRECYDCGVTYTMTATAMPPPVPIEMPTVGATTYLASDGLPPMAGGGGGASGAGGVVGDSAYSDLGGNLGPYDPEARREVLGSAAESPGPRGVPGLALGLTALGVVAALALVRRRLD